MYDQDDLNAMFQDRVDAGKQLANRLAIGQYHDPVVFGLPRGGVIVAAEVARALGAPLDVVVVRKIGAPYQPELGIGAVAEGGYRFVDESSVEHLHVSPDVIDRIAADKEAEIDRLLRMYRSGQREPVTGRTAIVVDDGLATGVTAQAAIATLRADWPASIVLAAPVCAAQSAAVLRQAVDELVCVHCADDFRAVGYWYAEFNQTSDDEVIRALAEARDDYARNRAAGSRIAA
jgi:predicted phosphoribosyltransferase